MAEYAGGPSHPVGRLPTLKNKVIPVSSLILKIIKLFEWKGKQHRVLESSCLERSVVRDIALLALGLTEMPPKSGANFFQVRLYYIVSS